MPDATRSYLAIARAIQAGIGDGTWKPGAALPGRAELMQRFGVARATVDRAIEFLVQSGALEGRQGAGTFVRAAPPAPRVAVIGSPLPAQDLPAEVARLTSLGYDQVASASARVGLARYDGLLWNRPEEQAVEWARELAGRVPQVLVNRTIPGFACVSTDHRGAYRAITGERLDRLPAGRAVFLRKAENASLVSRHREEGFVDACRERQRFFEPLPLPDGFDAKLLTLEGALALDAQRPLILVSDSLSHTGAVMAWARAHGVVWRRDAWYSDFDDDYPANVWGVAATSFIQEERQVHAAALARLVALIGGAAGPDFQLVFPRRRDGDT